MHQKVQVSARLLCFWQSANRYRCKMPAVCVEVYTNPTSPSQKLILEWKNYNYKQLDSVAGMSCKMSTGHTIAASTEQGMQSKRFIISHLIVYIHKLGTSCWHQWPSMVASHHARRSHQHLALVFSGRSTRPC